MKRKTKEQVFEEDFIPWVQEHGKLPSETSPDPTEKRLGQWKSRNKFKGWDKLIEFTSQYDPICKPKELVFTKDFIPWCKEHGRLPLATSPDPIERKLGRWRYVNRKWDKLIEFNSQYTPLCKSKERVFEEDFIPWCKEHGKLPSKNSPDPIERKLGKWRDSNRGWDKLIEFRSQYNPVRYKSREQVFEEDFIPWCKEHPGKLPRSCSPDSTEKKLGIWRVHNRGWDRLTQFSLLVKYSETSEKAKELLEKIIAAH